MTQTTCLGLATTVYGIMMLCEEMRLHLELVIADSTAWFYGVVLGTMICVRLRVIGQSIRMGIS